MGSWFGVLAGLFAVREKPAGAAIPVVDVTSLQDVALRSATGKPIIFIESPEKMADEVRDRLRQKFSELTGDKYEVVVMSDGVRLANQQAWRPQNLDIECGSISIQSQGGTGKGTKLLIDGVEPKHVRRITVDITPHDPVAVNVEFIARRYETV